VAEAVKRFMMLLWGDSKVPMIREPSSRPSIERALPISRPSASSEDGDVGSSRRFFPR